MLTVPRAFLPNTCACTRPARKCVDTVQVKMSCKQAKPKSALPIRPRRPIRLENYFSDGHDSGLYDWDYLYRLAHNQDALWQDYLDRLEKAGASRTPSAEDLKPKHTHFCGSGGCGGKAV